jgi:uncharacterized glyoxalase superfamily metalloenzyme YdcJ
MSKISPSALRREIVHRILANFENTMPIYGEMMGVAKTINTQAGEDEAKRLGKIMHAAIRCASPVELKMIRRIFALLACQPVNYYDLREKVSVQSTAFRPVSKAEIELNGFRIFCSMLSIDCIDDANRPFVESIIERRNVFPQRLIELVDRGEVDSGFEKENADEFIFLCVSLFVRPETALVSFAEHEKLQGISKVAAQVLVTNSLAFNHLTPSVASVPAAHQQMQARGIQTIPVWQGPVGKDVILRQTSCLAPPIKIKFPLPGGQAEEHPYQETFVEFEERLQALTPTGRQEFEKLFERGKQNLTLSESDAGYADHYYETMSSALAGFPSDNLTLWQDGLAYFTFESELDSLPGNPASIDFDQLIQAGTVCLIPQQYEDFFGPAATNIFNSNIGLEGVSNVGVATEDSKQVFESFLGAEVVNMYDYYERIQAESRQSLRHRWLSHSS